MTYGNVRTLTMQLKIVGVLIASYTNTKNRRRDRRLNYSKYKSHALLLSRPTKKSSVLMDRRRNYYWTDEDVVRRLLSDQSITRFIRI